MMGTVTLTTAFGTRMVIRNAVVRDHAWGETVLGWPTIEGELFEQGKIETRLDTATDVRWDADTRPATPQTGEGG